MLIIGREAGQSIIIGDDIKVTVLQKGSKLHLSVEAPRHISITRVKQNPNNIVKLKKQTRIVGETVQIGDLVKVILIQTESGLIRFAIDAPKEIPVFREEIYQMKNLRNNFLEPQHFKIFEFYHQKFV